MGTLTFGTHILPKEGNSQYLGSGSKTWILAVNSINFGTSGTFGSADTPIYWDSGVPKAGTKYASGTSITLNNSNKAGSTATVYAPTSGGTANTQALVGAGTTTEPKWVNIAPSITITAGTSSAAPKVNVTTLGQSGTAQAITTATSGVYGVTKLTASYSSGDATLAATGKSILAAIQTLDVTSVGGASGIICSISETDGKISATASSLTQGSATQGIYMSGGTISKMTYSLKADVNSGTANYLAYYSGNNAIAYDSNLQVRTEKTYNGRTIDSGNAGIISSKRIFASALETNNWALVNTDTGGNTKGFLLFGNNTYYGQLIVNTIGTTSTIGQSKLILGNSTASGTADNARGLITMYGYNDNAVDLGVHTTTHLLDNSFTDGGLDVGFQATGSLYRMWFGIGSGNQNRGIYQSSYNSGTSGWMIYWDSGQAVRIRSGANLYTLNASVDSGSPLYMAIYNTAGVIKSSSKIQTSVAYSYDGRTISSGNMGLLCSGHYIYGKYFETNNFFVANSNAASADGKGFFLQHSGSTVGKMVLQSGGTDSALGETYLMLGNSTASGTARNSRGTIYVYGTNAYRSAIRASTSANRVVTLPDVTGTVMVGSITSSTPSSPSNGYVWLRPI